MSSSAEARIAGGRKHLALREGVLAGLIGAAVVAGWFLVLDLFIGRMLFTPAALGSALFFGAEGPAAVQITASTVIGYTIIHVGAFLAVGMVFAALVAQAERQASVLLGIILIFVTTLTLAIGLMAILASWVLAELTWWGIAIGNLLAAAAMAGFMWKRHRALAGELSHAEENAAHEDGTAGPGWRGPGPAGPEGTRPEESPSGPAPHYEPRGPSTPEGGKPT